MMRFCGAAGGLFGAGGALTPDLLLGKPWHDVFDALKGDSAHVNMGPGCTKHKARMTRVGAPPPPPRECGRPD